MIEGVMGALQDPVELPSVYVPSDLPSLGSFWGEVGIVDQSGVYDEFVLGSEANVSIEGDVVLVITDRFYMDSGSHVTIEEGSSLTVYMVDTATRFYVDQGASVNNKSEDATKMMLYATDGYVGDVEIDQTTTYYGGVYAPNASIYLDNSSGFFGAAVGREVELDMNSKFHYDMSLDLFGITDKDGPYVVKSWHEVVH
jgi:hypothetical protein